MTSTMSTKRCLLLNHHHIDYKIIIIFAPPEWKFKAVWYSVRQRTKKR